ncbi:MAG: hypothetical protein JWQ98_3267 [Chlorobi bacterium]|nr:hypothetical protein [Chlorobiota bacterium]
MEGVATLSILWTAILLVGGILLLRISQQPPKPPDSDQTIQGRHPLR